MTKTHCVVIDHDDCPDFSWLEQDCFANSEYRDPIHHVALEMVAYDEDGNVIDSLYGIDFLAHEDNWKTGTFGRLAALDSAPYLQELAKEMGLS